MVLVMLRLTVSPDRRHDVVQTIRSTLSVTRATPGCVDCRIYSSDDETNRILYFAEWATEDELANHLRTNCWKGLIAVMEASADQPCIRFVWSDKSRGMEYLEAQRLGSASLLTAPTMNRAVEGAAPEAGTKICKPA